MQDGAMGGAPSGTIVSNARDKRLEFPNIFRGREGTGGVFLGRFSLGVLHDGGRDETHTPMNTSTHDEVAQRAYQIWQDLGCPSGRDEEIWFQAERQLLGENEAFAGGPASTSAVNRIRTETAARTINFPLSQGNTDDPSKTLQKRQQPQTQQQQQQQTRQVKTPVKTSGGR
jgi:hypothetical protein